MCYDVFSDAVKCILRHLQDLKKVGWFQYKNLAEKKINKYLVKKPYIGELVVRVPVRNYKILKNPSQIDE